MKDENIAKELSAIFEQLKTIFVKLDEIRATLHGNGRPGLVERVTTLEVSGNTKSGLVEKLIQWGCLIATAVVAVYGSFLKHNN
jgi:hypothetical protein